MRGGLLAAAILVAACGVARAAPPPAVQRIAVLVGTNASPPGRTALRFARQDAERMAAVLERVGRFRREDVHLLLDPDAGTITRLLDSLSRTLHASHTDAILVFYYSGHSDGQSVFPKGQALPLAELRARIESIGARLMLGILDTCRGSGWTQSKGLTVGPALPAIDLMDLTSEGTALLSSTSGLENAHEGEAVQGSFFTHHLMGGLVGAADRNGDGNITLQEAFDYARERTVRDSARLAPTTQHPSFDMQLRGRQDVVLAQVAASPSCLDLTVERGPLEVIHLATGVTVVEMAAGGRTVKLALAPGRYLVRGRLAGQTATKEIEILPGTPVTLRESELEATADQRLATKGGDAPAEPTTAASTLPPGGVELRVAAGATTGPGGRFGSGFFEASSDAPLARTFAAGVFFGFGITDRLTWSVPFPAVAYRLGSDPGAEVVVRGGLRALGYSRAAGLIGSPDVAVGVRRRVTGAQRLLVTAAAGSDFGTRGAVNDQPTRSPRIWRLDAGPAYTLRVRNVVTLGFGVHAAGPLRLGAHEPDGKTIPWVLVLGSVQGLGYRGVPLVSVHLSPGFALDGYASWAVNPRGGPVDDRYLAGFTWTF